MESIILPPIGIYLDFTAKNPRPSTHDSRHFGGRKKSVEFVYLRRRVLSDRPGLVTV